ncbi:hypothetical protein SAMN05518801_10778 [Novosphingobium sp. CF614]|uniref:hypothetical protein n=1 Tax=Novosphingobium sp. CF614 TaxID=1884364 RepID=UPI0008EB5182|nr:hypothetical protein [Novosphingobium sp. CF614]SFG09195.1 hypothetical protein SAMN05518801_10778 [Novosphingobium sp. CF614]
MTVPLHELATDWTGQTYEERLRLCAETLFVHGLLKAGTYHQATAKIRAHADLQRGQRTLFAEEPENG